MKNEIKPEGPQRTADRSKYSDGSPASRPDENAGHHQQLDRKRQRDCDEKSTRSNEEPEPGTVRPSMKISRRHRMNKQLPSTMPTGGVKAEGLTRHSSQRLSLGSYRSQHAAALGKPTKQPSQPWQCRRDWSMVLPCPARSVANSFRHAHRAHRRRTSAHL